MDFRLQWGHWVFGFKEDDFGFPASREGLFLVLREGSYVFRFKGRVMCIRFQGKGLRVSGFKGRCIGFRR